MPTVKATTPQERLDPKVRREQILNAAVALAKTKGYTNMTREAITSAAGVSPRLLNYYYKTMNQLKRDVMRHAIKNKVLEVIAQGLLAKDPHALKIPDDLKKSAVATLI